MVAKLYDTYVTLPQNNQEWTDDVKSFIENYEFPCAGAWDGFHVYVSSKLKSYFSFKKRYSMSNLALVGCNKRILYAVVSQTSTSTWVVLAKYLLLQFCYSAFPRHPWLLKNYSKNTSDPQQKYFNKKLCSARVVTENAFGMLKGRRRWRIL